ncbi:hypothetical protein TNCV_4897711 [Trichonephila clavipes]|nr:hypothetical protein TNCV_4897711 [Trichonephila clavipes]
MDGPQISCAALRALALNSREQLIREQREDSELGHIYRYLENPYDDSVNATQPTEGRRQGASGQYNRTRETRTATSGTNRAAERRRVRSKQATAVRPCPYYLRRRVKQPEGIP